MHKLERWLKFTKGQQIGAITAELMRAEIYQKQEKSNSLSAMERAIDLIDLTIDDKRWQGQRAMLFWLRDEICKFYLGINKNKLASIYKGL
ncbi:hypothetical protein KKD04_03030 [Patescibacteria group bacterium]|nr:hypothetical protein [Patescibacteria group bacterium]